MVRKGNLAKFESSKISETEEATLTKIGVLACDINPYLHEFFEPILIDSIFCYHGQKGKFAPPPPLYMYMYNGQVYLFLYLLI